MSSKDTSKIRFVLRSDRELIRQIDILSKRAKYADPNESSRSMRSRNYLINMIMREFVAKQIGKESFWLPVQIEEMEDRLKEWLFHVAAKEFSRLEEKLVEYYRKELSQRRRE